jgi:uncharacterized membrane protein YfcA
MDYGLLILAGFSAGFVDAVAGGGGLISLPALLALGLPSKIALGTNKCIGIATAAASTARYTLSGNVPWEKVFPMAALAGILAAAGAIGFYDGFFGPGTGTFLMMGHVHHT